jgi:hypothetical protein
VTDLPLATLFAVWEVLAPAFTRPSLGNLLTLLAGWVLATGPHLVTDALVAAGIAGRRHHAAFHRFFARARWDVDAVGRLVFTAVLDRLVPAGAMIALVIDDTLAQHKGAHVFGIGSHLDAVRSTKKTKIFAFGHVWVVLAVVVSVPFSSRPWALPVALRLYRNKKVCERRGEPYQRKTDLARELIDMVVRWAPDRRFSVALDQGYANETVMLGLPASVTCYGAIRTDAALTALPEPEPCDPGGKPAKRKSGRPRVRGQRLPTPQQLAADDAAPWQPVRLRIDGKLQTVMCKTLLAQWYQACRGALMRVVVVQLTTGKRPLRAFICSDPALSAAEALAGYANRWSIECTFKDLKQHLGFADPQCRVAAAVRRTAPMVAYLFSLLVLWFAADVHATPLAQPPIRPWYRSRRDAAFADILRAARRTLDGRDIADLVKNFGNLHNPRAGAPRRGPKAPRPAADAADAFDEAA